MTRPDTLETCWSCGGTGTRRDGWRYGGDSWENDCGECDIRAQVARLERTVTWLVVGLSLF